jgi:alkylation response protein AidB-like acyl-CoA dehydrogenase/catechol 2,3-dioxygenase-like lactoylglutathione lyase family enzyme
VEVVGLHHAAIVAADLEAARAFYADLIGLDERSDRPEGIRPGHWFDLGAAQLHVLLPGGPDNHFAVEVKDIDAAVAELRARGLDIADPYGIGGTARVDGQALQTIFEDPFGNRIEITQMPSRSGVRHDRETLLAWIESNSHDLDAWGTAAEAEGRLVAPLLDALHEVGMFRLLLPRWLDGAELDPMSFADVIGALAAHDASTAWCVCQAVGCSVAAAYLERAAAEEVFGGPRSVVAWGPDAGTSAIRVDDGYRVTGRWLWVSGVHHADWLGGSCRLVNADGSPVLGRSGLPESRTVLFPRSAATVVEAWNPLGLRATGTDSISVEELFVPAERSFARDDLSDRVDLAPLYCFNHAPLFSAGFAAVVLGVAGAMLEQLVSLAGAKKPHGQARGLVDSPVLQAQVARWTASLAASRSYLRSSLEDGWREAGTSGAVSNGTRANIRLATSHAFSEAVSVADAAFHAAGIDAIHVGGAFERRLRDIHTAAQQFQARDDHWEASGKAILSGFSGR